MASDPKAPHPAGLPVSHREKGVRIFTYPKIIFIFPTLIMSLICWIGMWWLGDVDKSHVRTEQAQASTVQASNDTVTGDQSPIPSNPDPKRFRRPENLLGLIF